MSAPDLKPCPFCGGAAEMDERQAFRELVSGRFGTAIAVACLDCGAQVSVCRPDVPDVLPEDVAGMWNQRVAS